MRFAVLFLLVVVLIVQLAAEAAPANVHVVSIREEQPYEVSPALSQMFRYTLYTVASDKFTYVLESADTRKPEIGKDYPVKEIAKGNMVLLIPTKKGPLPIKFYIKSVSEK